MRRKKSNPNNRNNPNNNPHNRNTNPNNRNTNNNPHNRNTFKILNIQNERIAATKYMSAD